MLFLVLLLSIMYGDFLKDRLILPRTLSDLSRLTSNYSSLNLLRTCMPVFSSRKEAVIYEHSGQQQYKAVVVVNSRKNFDLCVLKQSVLDRTSCGIESCHLEIRTSESWSQFWQSGLHLAKHGISVSQFTYLQSRHNVLSHSSFKA